MSPISKFHMSPQRISPAHCGSMSFNVSTVSSIVTFSRLSFIIVCHDGVVRGR